MLVETGLNNYENLFRIKSDGRPLGRVLHRVRHVEDPRRALLPLDRRVPAVGNPQGMVPGLLSLQSAACSFRCTPSVYKCLSCLTFYVNFDHLFY
jgi:hypothetical protein